MSPRNQPGVVRDAIIACLQGRASSVTEITSHVAQSLGSGTPASSVRSYLRLNTPQTFQKLERGLYQLASAPPVRGSTAPAEPEVAPEPVHTRGAARLFQGDCVKWLKTQKPDSLHAVVTDPPYGLVEYLETEQAKLRAGKGGVWRMPPSFDGHQRAPLPRFTTLKPGELSALGDFFHDWAKALLPVVVPGAHVILASNPLISYLVSYSLAGAGFERRGEIIRLVMTMRGGDRPKNAHDEFDDVSVMPRSMWEPWLLFRKPLEGRAQDNLRKWGTGGLRRVSESQPFGDVIKSNPTRPAERAIAPHPSLKPQAFLRAVVRASLPLGKGTVLDPFAGSGSTLAAAEAVGYASVGVEMDPQYIEVARKAIAVLADLPVDQSL